MFHGRLNENTARGLKVLRERIEAAKIPSSKLDETLNIATWNVRNFGSGRRSSAAIHLIAEIIGQFDLVALVEVRDNLSDLERVLKILGPYWRAVFSDFNTDAAGNRERIAFVFDKRAVVFTGLAAEADPPRKKVAGKYVSKLTWWRKPYMASFRAGNFDFVLLGVHVRWGSGGSAGRVPELQMLADWVAKRRKERYTTDKDFLVVGDFNIPSRADPTFAAITSKGLRVPKPLLLADPGTNLMANKRYDQILHHPVHAGLFTDKGGVLDFYAGDHAPLLPGMNLTKAKFTYQLSDHLPLWVQVNTDVDGLELEQLLAKWD